jgi:hypothetical protein
LRGRAAIRQLINERLPPAGQGPALRRHRFKVPSDDSLDVISASGAHVCFDVHLNDQKQITLLVKKST